MRKLRFPLTKSGQKLELWYNFGVIKAIVFDFSGVVAPGGIWGWVKDNLSEGDPGYTLFKQASKQWDFGNVSVDEFYTLVSHISGIPNESIEDIFYDKATYYPEVVEIIKLLKKEYKTVLFSNNFAYNVYKVLDKLNLRELFEEIIISSEHKMAKPDPRFFHLMLSMVKVEPYEAIFIDDRQENVNAGNSVGMKSFLYTNASQLITDLKTQSIKIANNNL